MHRSSMPRDDTSQASRVLSAVDQLSAASIHNLYAGMSPSQQARQQSTAAPVVARPAAGRGRGAGRLVARPAGSHAPPATQVPSSHQTPVITLDTSKRATHRHQERLDNKPRSASHHHSDPKDKKKKKKRADKVDKRDKRHKTDKVDKSAKIKSKRDDASSRASHRHHGKSHRHSHDKRRHAHVTRAHRSSTTTSSSSTSSSSSASSASTKTPPLTAAAAAAAAAAVATAAPPDKGDGKKILPRVAIPSFDAAKVLAAQIGAAAAMGGDPFNYRHPKWIDTYEEGVPETMFLPFYQMLASDKFIMCRTSPSVGGGDIDLDFDDAFESDDVGSSAYTMSAGRGRGRDQEETKSRASVGQPSGQSANLVQVLIELPQDPDIGKLYQIGVLHSDPLHQSSSRVIITRSDTAITPFWKYLESVDDGNQIDADFLQLVPYKTEQNKISWMVTKR